MGKPTGGSLVICALLVLISISLSGVSFAAAAADGGYSQFQVGWFPAPATGECRGSMAECMALEEEEEEFQMDSEINRRILAGRRYISYGALSRNRVPCSRRGASYYNCRRGGSANPYQRGCSAITRCRR
ncbi:rapid alkalinization factor-like [Diospyros lotus]|uniref:rapid alkalinization factor-like n=1 Tax=Diospyros lotus TaxID=55363 RepID=UPI0022520665|nr:rapid alkalinization factor-like [Diospyros lotus]